VVALPKVDKKGDKKPKDATAAGLPKTTENVKKRDGRDDVFVRSEVAPLYLGGEAAMMKYLQKNLKYPTISKENGVKGTVFVQFVVEKDGKVDDVTVLKGVDNLLNAEAKRVVAAMPKWAAGQQNGRAVAVQYVLPVKFDLIE
jgi:periplasmic protein TonB